MKLRVILFSLILFSGFLDAQELNCTVQINSDQIEGSNKQVFSTLQKSISEFINNRKWCEMTFANSERIECSMNIIVKKVDGDVMTCELQVQSRRPATQCLRRRPIPRAPNPASNSQPAAGRGTADGGVLLKVMSVGRR